MAHGLKRQKKKKLKKNWFPQPVLRNFQANILGRRKPVHVGAEVLMCANTIYVMKCLIKMFICNAGVLLHWWKASIPNICFLSLWKPVQWIQLNPIDWAKKRLPKAKCTLILTCCLNLLGHSSIYLSGLLGSQPDHTYFSKGGKEREQHCPAVVCAKHTKPKLMACSLTALSVIIHHEPAMCQALCKALYAYLGSHLTATTVMEGTQFIQKSMQNENRVPIRSSSLCKVTLKQKIKTSYRGGILSHWWNLSFRTSQIVM